MKPAFEVFKACFRRETDLVSLEPLFEVCGDSYSLKIQQRQRHLW